MGPRLVEPKEIDGLLVLPGFSCACALFATDWSSGYWLTALV